MAAPVVDISLDDVVLKRGGNRTRGRGNRGRMRGGRGGIISSRFNRRNGNVGRPSVSFDAREKLLSKTFDARQILKPKDARLKLQVKDARQKLNLKSSLSNTVTVSNQQNKGQQSSVDARQKINDRKQNAALQLQQQDPLSRTVNNELYPTSVTPTPLSGFTLARRPQSKDSNISDTSSRITMGAVAAKRGVDGTQGLMITLKNTSSLKRSYADISNDVPAFPTSTKKFTPDLSNNDSQEVIIEEDVISPLQGYKIHVTNLHSEVTEEDIVELFGAVGALKKAKLVKPGFGEVVYVKREDAVSACKRYDSRELDGQPMNVKLMTTGKPPATTDDLRQELLKQNKKSSDAATPHTKEVLPVDVELIHKALYKKTSGARPVTFRVKI